MYLSRSSKRNLFAKKHIQNLTFESIGLSIQDLKRVEYPSWLIKKCFELLPRDELLSNFEPEINIFFLATWDWDEKLSSL